MSETIILIKAEDTVNTRSKLQSNLTEHYNINQFNEEMSITFLKKTFFFLVETNLHFINKVAIN